MFFSPMFIRNHKSHLLLENENDNCSRFVVSSKNDSFHFPGSLPCLQHFVIKRAQLLQGLIVETSKHVVTLLLGFSSFPSFGIVTPFVF